MYFADEKEKKDVEDSTKSSKSEDGNENEDEDELQSMAGSKESDVASMSGTIYDKIGFEEDKIAIGIDPDDVSFDFDNFSLYPIIRCCVFVFCWNICNSLFSFFLLQLFNNSTIQQPYSTYKKILSWFLL